MVQPYPPFVAARRIGRSARQSSRPGVAGAGKSARIQVELQRQPGANAVDQTALSSFARAQVARQSDFFTSGISRCAAGARVQGARNPFSGLQVGLAAEKLPGRRGRSEEHTSELQSQSNL